VGVCGGVVGLLLLRHYMPTDGDTSRWDQVSNQIAEQGPSGRAEARGEAQLIPIAPLKAEQAELGRRLMQEFPNSEAPRVLLGHVYKTHGNNDRAVELWHQALVMNPRPRRIQHGRVPP